jgi:hypothetical protein
MRTIFSEVSKEEEPTNPKYQSRGIDEKNQKRRMGT